MISNRTLWTLKLQGKPVPRQAASTLGGAAVFCGRILGVDPSLRGTGIAVVDTQRTSRVLVHSERIAFGSKKQATECLGALAQRIEALVKLFEPEHIAMEQLIYVQNMKVAQVLGAARGAIIAGATRVSTPAIFEYPPTRIKQAITGKGSASKEQVQRFIKALLSIHVPLSMDESDAAAVALCHAFCYSL